MVHINHLSKRKKKENKRNNRSNNTAPAEFNPYNKDISLDAQINPPRSQLNNEMDLAEGKGIKRVLFSWRVQHPPLSPQGRTNGRYPLPPLFLSKEKNPTYLNPFLLPNGLHQPTSILYLCPQTTRLLTI